MNSRPMIAIAVSSLLLSACSGDPKEANERNFKTALQSYLDSKYPRCYVVATMPYAKEFDFTNNRATLKALAKAGLVVETEVSRKEVPVDFSGKTRTQILTSFDLTEEGKKYYRKDAVKNLAGDDMGGFCAGKAKVEKINQFSEPADMFGAKISRVSYSYSVSDLPGWAKDSEVAGSVEQLKKDVASEKAPVNENAVLVLTNNGWVHQALFDKKM